MKVKSIYEDVADDVEISQNGSLSFERFNRFSRRAELKFLDWLTGKIEVKNLPQPYLTQKNKDWVSPFIVKLDKNVVNGEIDEPSDYYLFEDIYRIGSKANGDCDDDDVPLVNEKKNPVITLLESASFNMRANTYIEEQKPSLQNAIAKRSGKKFEFRPVDIGSITLEYVRYPKFAEIKSTLDTVYNEQIIDEANSTDYEWGEYARNLLVWFIVDEVSNNTREQALKATNAASKP